MADRKDDLRDDFEQVPRENWIPVMVPSEDLMGHTFPNPRINSHEFEAGQEHMVPPSYAETLNIIIARANKDAVRLLRPTADIESLRQQAGGGASDKRVKYTPAI